MIPIRGLPCILFRRYQTTLGSNSLFHYQRIALNVKQDRWYAAHKDVVKTEVKDTKDKVSVDYMEVVKENTATAGYLVVIAVAFSITSYIFYFIIKELFSGNSPLGVYNRAAELCQKDTRLLDALGQPVKVYGEGRRRRNHYSHGFYERNGVKYMRVKFYIEGIRYKGTVYAEAKEVSGNYEFTSITVQVNDMFGTIYEIKHT